jgi:hypothetical protein
MSIIGRIEEAFSNEWKYVEPILKLFLTTLGKEVLAQAITVCGQVAVTMAGQAGSAKKTSAFNLIVSNLKANGVSTIENDVVNAAIETAVQYQKASAPPAAASAAPAAS